jgi:hypothetical protein
MRIGNNQMGRYIRLFPMRLLQNSERPAEGPGVLDPHNMEYTRGNAKEIGKIENNIEQQASINN